MDGVMMQGPERTAIAMRLPSGELYLKTKMKPKDPEAMKIPVVRGVIAFARSLVNGMSTLMESADILEKYAPGEYAGEETRFEKWVNKKFGDRAAWNILMTVSLIFAIVISIALFVILPTWAVNIFGRWIKNTIVLNLIEGVLRIAIFIGYIVLIRRMDEIGTLFKYHGAEHKTIHCYENNLELTPQNAQQFYTLHPRCGTSFMMFVLIISLLLFSLLGWPNLALRIVSRLVLIPVIAGLSYELLKWAGRSDGAVVKILSWPGLMLQRLTTDEPTDEQLEVAILSLKAVLVEKDFPVIEGFVDKDGNMIGDPLWKPGSEVMSRKLPDEDEDTEEKNSEEAINEAIKFLDGLDDEGYTMVVTDDGDGVSLAQGIADHYQNEAKQRAIANRFTNDITTIENALQWGQAALSMIENGEMLEHSEVYDDLKGVPRFEIEKAIQNGKDMILRLDYQGMRKIKAIYHEAISVFIIPPDAEAWINRLPARNTDSEESLALRVNTAVEELKYIDEFDYILINDEIDHAAMDLLTILRAEHMRSSNRTVKITAD